MTVMIRTASAVIIALVLWAASPMPTHAGSVTGPNNKHNLSVSGPGIAGVTKSTTEERVCIFCHTPHHATSGVTPLWTRKLSSATYDLYASASLKSSPNQPTGSSRLCLSCHDGTIALGMTHSGTTIGGLSAKMPVGRTNLGGGSDVPDLSNDHPISFEYPSSQAEFVPPGALPGYVRLEDDQVQCTSCHDPHNDTYPNFQVVDNNTPGSPLCVTCHRKDGWATSSHAAVAITYPAVPPATSREVYSCEACHVPHSAPQKENLLRGTNGRDTCLLACHNGTLPLENYGRRIDHAFQRIYTHRIGEAPGVHLSTEDTRIETAMKHVECFDCHNPHQTRGSAATAPSAAGSIQGVKVEKLPGGDFRLSTTEYDICFKCHAESNATFAQVPETLPDRQFTEFNERLRFSIANSSFHPVLDRVDQAKVNTTGLKSSYISRSGELVPLDVTSIIYCHDCHDPHGSNDSHMLVARYQQETYAPSYSSADYALCYRCHDETRLLDGFTSSFPPHRSHVMNPTNEPAHANRIPCSVCHDPHGVQTNGHLVNFDTSSGFVSPTAPVPVYNAVSKTCVVSCHANPAIPRSY